MEFIEAGGNTYIKGISDFSLEQTMECGQCFHFQKLGKEEYGLVASGKFLHARQTDDELCLFDTRADDAKTFWRHYFDLDRDYAAIKQSLLSGDDKLQEAVSTMWGVRILNQEFFETLISFIISQNKQIPHIKQIVALLSERFGNKLAECGGYGFYSFPTAAQIRDITIEELKSCKTGFRAPYIYDAVKRVNEDEFNEAELRSMQVDECNNILMNIHGVGPKVANCVSLFGLGHREAFPVDVWIKRIVESLYFEGKDIPVEKIGQFGCEQFGEYGGYAQQYLFYYGKTIKAGVKQNVNKI